MRVPVLAQQPRRDLPRVSDQGLIVCLGQQEHMLHPHLQPDPAESLRQLPDPPGHIGQLPLGEQTRVGRRLGAGAIVAGAFVLGLVFEDVVEGSGSARLALSLEQGVHEACAMLAGLGMLAGLARGVEGRLAAVIVLRVEDYLSASLSRQQKCKLAEGSIGSPRIGLDGYSPLRHAGTPNRLRSSLRGPPE